MINHFPLAGSGSGTYTKNLAVHLAELGHEVTVILPENTLSIDPLPGVRLHPVFFTPEDGSPAPSGALPFNFPCFTTHPRSTMTFAELSEPAMDMYMEAFRRAIAEEVETFRPDLIHGQHVWILSALAAEHDIPLVLTAHGTDLVGLDKWPEFRPYAERAMAACRKVIAISKDNVSLLETVFPEYRTKIVLMRNGYNPAVFFPADLKRRAVLGKYDLDPDDYEDKEIIIFAGKLTWLKGVDVLLEAVKIYEDAAPDTLTLIVGDGEERDNLEAQAKALGLRSVRFLGNVDQDELCRLYNVSDIDVVPSRKEAFGLVAIEAMACGLPVIATNQGGFPDFVNRRVGALVEPENAGMLAQTVLLGLEQEESMESDAWRQDIASYARWHYAQDAIMHELEALYSGCLDE